MPKALQYVAQTGFVESLFWTLDGVIFTLILAAKIPKSIPAPFQCERLLELDEMFNEEVQN